jgi:thiol-disulfide isomerase/thioredoxin
MNMMTYNRLIAALLFAVSLTFTGCGGGSDSPETATVTESPTETETPATETADTPANETVSNAAQVLGTTTITSTTGQTIQVDRTPQGFVFHGYEGKIVLLEVYGDTCPHCIEAIPSYNRLQAKYANDIIVIALESYGTLSNAAQQQYITIPLANAGNMFSFIRDLTGYNREAVPFLMVFDKNGDKVYQNILATFPEAEIEGLIQSLR